MKSNHAWYSGALTVGELRAALANVDDSVWICMPGGPAFGLKVEMGANEPFVALLPREKPFVAPTPRTKGDRSAGVEI